MILGEKILNLRKKSGWSQEELSEKLNVSRQSISKWESASSIPDINKIIEIAKLFEVTTDYLLKDDMEAVEYTDEDSVVLRKVTLEESKTYLKENMRYNKRVAIGTSLCIMSPVTLILCGGLSNEGMMSENMAGAVGIITLLLLVCVAVGVFILMDRIIKPYTYLSSGEFDLEYGVRGILDEKRKVVEDKYPVYTAIGVGMCILSVLPLLIMAFMDQGDLSLIISLCCLFPIITVAVAIFIISGAQKAGYDVLLGESEQTAINKEDERRVTKFGGFYWPVVTAVYLGWSFLTADWKITWIVWVVAALLFAGISALLKKGTED